MPAIRYSAQEPVGRPEPVAVWTTSLTAVWETDIDTIATVLPRPLVPSDEPLVRARISRVEYDGFVLGASVHCVRAVHGDVEGWYDLTMVMDREAAVTIGRETYGEPKKLGQVTLERSDDRVHGTVARQGVTYLELEGTVAESLPLPPDATRTSFYFKFLLDPTGNGFDNDPSLVHCFREETWRRNERIDGDVTLRESPFDPVIDLPVRAMRSFALEEHATKQWAETAAVVPAEWVLPFVHQRYDTIARIPKPEPAGAAS